MPIKNYNQVEVLAAPFTDDEIEALNSWQKSKLTHPYTCGSGNRTDAAHTDGEGVLVATRDGWICPFCDYTQDWAAPFTAKLIEELKLYDADR